MGRATPCCRHTAAALPLLGTHSRLLFTLSACACVHACMHMCVRVCTRACVCAHVRACAHTCVRVCEHVCAQPTADGPTQPWQVHWRSSTCRWRRHVCGHKHVAHGSIGHRPSVIGHRLSRSVIQYWRACARTRTRPTLPFDQLFRACELASVRVCVHGCMCACERARVCAWVCASVRACVHGCMGVCVCVRASTVQGLQARSDAGTRGASRV